ncbi:MAG: host attachment protein [Rhizobiaceae bacterium]|nr:host attachment protein [Rhizobiaceae bacterium]
MERLALKHGLWLVVADGEKALFMKNDGDAKFPNFEVFSELNQENSTTRETVSDKPGRFNDGPSPHRSAVQETDLNKLAKMRFADEIAEKLYKAAHNGDFEYIVIAAPPSVLGELRKKMHQVVTDKIVTEIPKTLTNLPVYDIEKMLQAA